MVRAGYIPDSSVIYHANTYVRLVVMITLTHDLAGTRVGLKSNSTLENAFLDGGRTSSITCSTSVGVDLVKGYNYALDCVAEKTPSAWVPDGKCHRRVFLMTDLTHTINIDPFPRIQATRSRASEF
jgi:hypothetical protein